MLLSTAPGLLAMHSSMPHHHLRLRPSMNDLSVTRQSGSALWSCPVGLLLKRNVYNSSLRGALSDLLPRFRSPQCLVALCMVHSIEAERKEGGNFWMWAVWLRWRTSKEACTILEW